MKNNYTRGPTLATLLVVLTIATAAMPTPRSADGHVDLSGYWEPLRTGNPFGANNPGIPIAGGRGSAPTSGSTANEIHVFPLGAAVTAANAADVANVAARKADRTLRPKYQPQFAARAAENFDQGDLNDPTYGCLLPGVVRLGLPREIFQRPRAVVLLYEGAVNHYRVVPIDGRKPVPEQDALPMGHPIGRWDGNTLVIETTGFYGDYWLDKDGSYYSEDLRLTERLTREGNTLKYELVAEDPMFAEAFKPAPRTLVLAKEGTHIEDEYSCNERDLSKLINGAKH